MPTADGVPILELHQLQIGAQGPDGSVRPLVDAVSLIIAAGERVALVGESGCGKTLTALASLGICSAPLLVSGGCVVVGGQDLASTSRTDLQRLRGGTVGLVFQEPAGALNPVFSVGFQLLEMIHSHSATSRRQAREERDELLARVGLVPAREVARAYPHQLSGGQLQRVMLAVALAGHPRLLIADEPTTALDLTTQARILGLIRSLSEEEGLALLLITHDIAVVAALVERIVVMHAGEIVEQAPTSDLLSLPLHPYTRELLAAVPRTAGRIPGPAGGTGPTRAVPQAELAVDGCRFADRCPLVQASCRRYHPSLEAVRVEHLVRCPVVVSKDKQ